MSDRAILLLARALHLVAPLVVTACAFLLLGLELRDRTSPPPQVVVVPPAQPCAAPPSEAATPTPQPAPVIPPPPPTPIVIGASAPSDLLGVIDIRRDELERLLSSAELRGSARVRVHERDGRPDGVRLVGVCRGSLLWAAGLRSGDVIDSVNGRSAAIPDALLDVYASRPAFLDVHITRRGHTARLLVLVHDAPAAPG